MSVLATFRARFARSAAPLLALAGLVSAGAARPDRMLSNEGFRSLMAAETALL
jgi:hypothetical protein